MVTLILSIGTKNPDDSVSDIKELLRETHRSMKSAGESLPAMLTASNLYRSGGRRMKFIEIVEHD